MDLLITTEVRGRECTLTWRPGHLAGDEELLDRVRRAASGTGVDLGTADCMQIIHLCREATPAPLDIVSTDPAEDPERRMIIDLTADGGAGAARTLAERPPGR